MKQKENENKTRVRLIREDPFFIEFLKRRKVSNKNTINRYIFVLNLFIKVIDKPLSVIISEAKTDYLNNVFPDEGTVFKYITLFQEFMTKKGYSVSTRSNNLYFIRGFYKTFFIPVSSKIGKEKQHKRTKSLEDILTLKDIKRLWLLSPLFLKALILTCFSTGLRISDILKLNCKDFIKFTFKYHGKNEINDALKNIDIKNCVGVIHNVALKNEKSHYTYLNPQAIKWLVNYLLSRDDDLSNDSPLFLSKKGERLNYQSASYCLKKIRKKLKYNKLNNSKINKVTFHAFRNSFATILLPRVDYFRLENLMGHAHSENHSIYYIQNKDEDEKLYREVMSYLMFNEDNCYNCSFCKHYVYYRVTNKKSTVKFKYCHKIKDIIEGYEYNINYSNKNLRVRISSKKQAKLEGKVNNSLTSLIKLNKKADFIYINGDLLDFRYCNLYEVSRSDYFLYIRKK